MEEKVYNFKYVDENELMQAAQAIVDAALLCQEAKQDTNNIRLPSDRTPSNVSPSVRVLESNKETLVDAVFEDPSLAAYLFQAGSPFEAE